MSTPSPFRVAISSLELIGGRLQANLAIDDSLQVLELSLN